MSHPPEFDVIIIGGSYAGLSAALALGRASRKTLIIDGGKPCNRMTRHSHNFLTHDGDTPSRIANAAKKEVAAYDTIEFVNSIATNAVKSRAGFEVKTSDGNSYHSTKLIFASGIVDQMPDIKGFSECWGISALHCPYCHGYEVKGQRTGVLANGDIAFEFATMISHWSPYLTLYTNGPSTLSAAQKEKLVARKINIEESPVTRINHQNGYMKSITLKNGETADITVLYAKRPFQQHSDLPAKLGCEFTEEGYIKVDPFMKTSVHGILACGDNSSKLRTVANAVATGQAAGMIANKEMIEEG